MRWVYIALTLLALSGDARAQGTTLSNLSAGTAITSTDLFYDVQTVGIGGVKVTGGQLVTFMNSSLITGATSTVQFNNNGTFGGFGTWDGTNLTVPSVIVSNFSTQGMVCNSSTGVLSTTISLCSGVTSTGTGALVRANTATITSPIISLGSMTSPTITTPTIAQATITSPTITSPTINIIFSQADNTGSIGTSTTRFTSIYGVSYYASASVAGVTCAAGTVSTATLTITNGIVTHC